MHRPLSRRKLKYDLLANPGKAKNPFFWFISRVTQIRANQRHLAEAIFGQLSRGTLR